eukprot:CAMPEP_0174724180 /NCGR_PEP_ID=MMETSP1094-20130205/42751_1 /TAXON_ID=156173 /ORGANISM="Chrysochromulina brevifilum, Strain UTEX LB 985" /LENGTH=45 /DNA_ID= /DNA_START= /DNA_END= /DNA_ORIENTATION=
MQQHDEKKLARREEALTHQFNAVVEKYAAAMHIVGALRPGGEHRA